MLSLSKHTYRVIERLFNDAVEMLRQAQHDKSGVLRDFQICSKKVLQSFEKVGIKRGLVSLAAHYYLLLAIRSGHSRQLLLNIGKQRAGRHLGLGAALLQG